MHCNGAMQCLLLTCSYKPSLLAGWTIHQASAHSLSNSSARRAKPRLVQSTLYGDILRHQHTPATIRPSKTTTLASVAILALTPTAAPTAAPASAQGPTTHKHQQQHQHKHRHNHRHNHKQQQYCSISTYRIQLRTAISCDRNKSSFNLFYVVHNCN